VAPASEPTYRRNRRRPAGPPRDHERGLDADVGRPTPRRGADLFVCEAYFFEKKIKYHLDYQTLRENRQRLDCRRIVLTHMSADVLRRRSEAEVECANDGQVITL
jgi:phosphoribosyl 1,2-cyclic phosphodiesterase